MTGRWQPYLEYRDSGVDWLGEIPTHWETAGLRYVLRLEYGDSLPADLREVGDVPVFGSNGHVGTHSQPNTLAPVLVVGRKGSYGKVSFCDQPVFAIDTTYYTDSRSTSANLRWLFYALRLLRLDSFSQDSAVPRLSRDYVYQQRMPAIPLSEQRAVAAFLDRQTAKIDTLIAGQQQLIELLQERRAALIGHAVTKGFDPDVPMKDSGVERLGRIPSHWSIVRLGYLARVLNGSTPSRSRADYWSDGTIPWLSSGKVNDDVITEPSEWITEAALQECSLEVIPTDSVVIGLVGQGRTRAMSALMGIDATTNQNMAAIIPRTRLRGRFLHYVLQQMYSPIRESGQGANQAALNCEVVADLRVLVPPVSEQEAIAVYLDRETEKIDAVVGDGALALDQLDEYRTALIAAAVTGKIKVDE